MSASRVIVPFRRSRMLGTIMSDARQLFRYRFLINRLVARDLHIKYRSSVLGYLWSLLNPCLMILTYVLAFKYVLGMRTTVAEGPNFVVSLIIGIIIWELFAGVVSSSADCMIHNVSLFGKVNFPRMVPLLANHLFHILQHLMAYPFLAIVIFGFYRVPIGVSLLWVLPLFLILNVFLLGLAMILSTLTVSYRDVAHFLQLGLRVLFWFTPILYPLDKVPPQYVEYIRYTPLSPLVACVYDVFCMQRTPEMLNLGLATLYAVVAMVLGLWLFYSHQHRFVEEI